MKKFNNFNFKYIFETKFLNMKKLIPLFAAVLLFGACENKCQDKFCPTGMICVDGRCTGNINLGCPEGYEGDDCSILSSNKFIGSYDVEYQGMGNLSESFGETVLKVSKVEGSASRIRLDFVVNLNANIMNQNIMAPVTISVEGYVKNDQYFVPETKIQTSISAMGFPIPISFGVAMTGTKEGETILNSSLKLTGTFDGEVKMNGVKK